MSELQRIRSEYARRSLDARYRDWYSSYNRGNIFNSQERDRELSALLGRAGHQELAEKRILDIGCGAGSELAKLVGHNAKPKNLFGIDLLPDRLQTASARYANLQFSCSDASMLPYPDQSFDIILQFTVFSSVLDAALRHRIAQEMLRVLKPSGSIIWYDFRLNPTNSQTRGIERHEIGLLFPNCRCRLQRITLAPPIARILAPRSWSFCQVLSCIPVLKTHYLGLIQKREIQVA